MRAKLRIQAPELAAKALEPDNPPQLSSSYRDSELELQLELPKLSSLASCLDDYLINLEVALQVLRICHRFSKSGPAQDQ